MFTAHSELSSLGLLSQKELSALIAWDFVTLADLLDHFPKRYEDRRRFDDLSVVASAEAVCLRGTVIDAAFKYSGPRRAFFEAVVLNGPGGIFGTGKITCRWFNMPFVRDILAVGLEVILYGKVKESNGRLVIDHPEFEVLRHDESDSIHLERIVPIYKNVAGIGQRRLREIIHSTLLQVEPATLSAGSEIPEFSTGAAHISAIHFPATLVEAKAARRRFALAEFFALQLNVVWRRSTYARKVGRVLGKKTVYLKKFHASLPFDLTGAQVRSIKEILADMRSPSPMNRLLQGDVGSGKTFVAMAAMLLAIDSGCQAALMVPTQILAEQHYLTFRQWLEPLGVRVALRTSNREEINHLEISGDPQIVIGTHALLYGNTGFRDLGLVVIDEQHKFGVAQRASLINRGITPDVLVMTATPIPRTLTMTAYGDLDVSLLDEKPPGRGKIVTHVRVTPKQADVTKFVKDQLSLGHQAYLVYPLVDESEHLKIGSAIEAFAKWQKRLGATYPTGLIHGKLRPDEKETLMRKFRDGEIVALVSTSVIEVGVDVPNASVMIIHHAERFGLAQLHQLRGRIGRGGHKGYCILLTDGRNPEAMEKLQVLEKTSDGFEIAEEDLRLRGPGDVLGNVQSGVSQLRFIDFLADTALLREARDLADKVIAHDPQLTGVYQRLRDLIKEPDDPDPFPSTA